MLKYYIVDYSQIMLFGKLFAFIEARQQIKRFKMASVLNVLGLSIAFVAFMLIMMQVNYDYTFDRSPICRLGHSGRS